MKKFSLFILFSVLLFNNSFPQNKSFESLLIQKETDPSIYYEAKLSAIKQSLPVSIKFPDGILIDVIKEEEGRILYSVIKNLANPFSDGEILTYREITERFDLNKADINWGNQPGETSFENKLLGKILLVPDWTNDNVLSFDPVSGDLLNANFIPPSPGVLASPKHALLHPAGFITVSDQIQDVVQKFDSSGTFLGRFAPADSVNPAILDNLRGHAYKRDGNLVVTVGSGPNQNGIPEFDYTGHFISNYITNGAGGLNSPFCVLFRDNDVLVTGSSSDAVHRYDLNGAYLNNLITGVQFPQQVIELPNKNLALAIFSTPSGLGIYNSTGTQLSFFTQVTGLRSAYQLPNGNFLVTNAGGLHEINGTNGTLIRTIYSSANMQYISLIDYTAIPVELISFSADVEEKSVILNWSTATELNNSGFEIERLVDNNISESWIKIGFVKGEGTTTQQQFYSFTDENLSTGKYKYRLKQMDFDGAFEYSKVIEAVVEIPIEFSLVQNYPNPFNPSTKIKFSLPVDAKISLKLFNSLGELINEVLEGNYTSGLHEIDFNGFKLSSGNYFYSLTALGSNGELFYETKKMTLLK
jgi:hypothetical protein